MVIEWDVIQNIKTFLLLLVVSLSICKAYAAL